VKALTYHGPGSVRYEDAPDPAIVDPADAIVRVEATAICGSDLHVYEGRERGLDQGTVLGHEFAGRIVAAGPGVDAALLAIGNRVVSPFTTSCGRCFYCARGLTARCTGGRLFGWVEDGLGLHGGQAALVRVPMAAATLFSVPDDLPLDLALFLGDVLATGYHGATLAGAGPGVVCAVIGCGPIGLAGVVCARELGAEAVFALDTVPERLALAARFGATAVDAAHGDVAQVVRAATDGRGADAVLEAVGAPSAGKLAFDLVRPGGTIAVVGVHHETAFAFSPQGAYDKNLTYRTGRCPARGLMDAVLPIARRRGEDLAAIVTHRLPLAEGPAAYVLFAAKRDGCIKVVLTP
jgi:threonine dehydrogenase-like Zn-dependent dehydrogenase